MLSVKQSFHEVISEDVVLFTEDCSPYYVGPAISRTLWGKTEKDSLIEEVTRIVNMISSLELKLSYIMQLQSAPRGSSIKCDVSKFSHGYKVKLIGAEDTKAGNIEQASPGV